MRKNYIAEFDIEKTGLDIILKIKVNKELEKFFSDLENGQVNQSQRWTDSNQQGLFFFTKTEKTKQVLSSINNNFQCFDDFGSGLINEGRINIAIFRIKDLSAGTTFKVTELIAIEELKNTIAELGKIAKYIFVNYIAKTKITARISYEI